MNTSYLKSLVEKLGVWGVQFEGGLSDQEIINAEDTFGFVFPQDLRMFLQHALPTSKGWPNWRNGSREDIQQQIDWPFEGMCFDIEHNVFWMHQWGDRPENLTEAFSVAREHVTHAPFLIPVLGHRYIPAEPGRAGNPVISVYQTDIIHYGNDLASYFANEFKADSDVLPQWHVPCPDWAATSPRPIRFWDDIIEMNG